MKRVPLTLTVFAMILAGGAGYCQKDEMEKKTRFFQNGPHIRFKKNEICVQPKTRKRLRSNFVYIRRTQ